jgi:hypothetical protein
MNRLILQPPLTDILPNGARTWATGASDLTVLTYSFMASRPSDGGADVGTDFQVANQELQDAVRRIFQRLGTDLGLSFREVSEADGNVGTLRFGVLQLKDAKGAAYRPHDVPIGDSRAGDVYMDVDTLVALKEGQEGWQALLHEIGHALGLDHPRTGSQFRGAIDSVMTVNSPSNGLWQSWFGPSDLAALRSVYGEPMRTAVVRDTIFELADGLGESMSTLSDFDAGSDTLDASRISTGVYLDLRPGGLSSVGLTGEGAPAVDNLVTDWNTQIEHVKGSEWDDIIVGNDSDNFFVSNAGNDRLIGGDGFDVVLVPGRLQNHTVEASFVSGVLFLVPQADPTGVKTIDGIERVQFEDGGGLAFDIVGVGGQAYRIYKAAFNRTPDSGGLGYWIGQMDLGMGLIEVSARFIDSKEFRDLYGAAPTNAEFLAKVYTNVLGRTPDQGGYDWWLNAMNTDPSKTFAKVLADFSESAENQTGTAELVAMGIAYEPWSG